VSQFKTTVVLLIRRTYVTVKLLIATEQLLALPRLAMHSATESSE
jgi:hypothetical protein